MTRRFSWAAALLLLFVLVLLVYTPARLLAVMLPAEDVLMAGYEGTVWRGAAARCLLRMPAGYLHLGAVHWSLEPLSLLTGSPRLTVSSRWGTQTLTTEVVLRGERSLDISGLQANVAADLLRQVVPVALTGSVEFDLARLELRDGLPVSSRGRVIWRDGGWRTGSTVSALGSYALDINSGGAGQITAKVLTLAGPVEASGSLQLHHRHYAVDVRVTGQQPMQAELQQALSLIGAPENGAYRVLLNGQLE